MPRFIAFDVETPNRFNNRISSIGITVIEDGAITGGFSSLVDPETHFDYFNTALTGISEETVAGAPTFPQLWERIAPLMSSGLLVAHNAPFDMGVLKKCLNDYGIEWKPYARYVCTVRMGRDLLPGMRHNLDVMCRFFGIPLDHHQAESDSRACAELLLKYMEKGADVRQFIRTCSFKKAQ
ncbi:MAG: 3'-5' exonuclease [Clostridia bacterium]|jgi:DNA polymerase-3 subunit epsilon|nr:3'-5' exonuclease [Clostridia bacterium]